MHTILLSPTHGTMTVVSQRSLEYPVLIHLNYEVLFTGTRQQCEERVEELETLIL